MTDVAIRPEDLREAIAGTLGDKAREVALALGEVTVTVDAAHYLAAMQLLRDAPRTRFDQLIDLCVVDYSTWRDLGAEGPRYAVVSHLLSVALNQRVRVKVFCADDDFPSCLRSSRSGAARVGSSAKGSICSASSLKATKTCAAS